MDIKRFFKTMAEEWERTLMSVFIFSIFFYLAALAYNMLVEDEGSSQNSVKPKAPHRFFDTTSTAYIEPFKLPDTINPFNFHIKITLPPPPKKQDPQPPKPEAKKPDKKQEPKPEGKKTPPKETKTDPKAPPKGETKPNTPPPQKPEVKPQPKKPARKISVQYRGFLKGTTEQQVAFYSALDSQGKKTEAKSAKEGAKIHGIIPIKSFDANQMVVSVGGKDVVVKRGKKQDFNIQ